MRTASIIGAVEFASVFSKIARQAIGKDSQLIGLGRKTVGAVLQRADEPGEALGYWMSTYPGKQIPKPVKRGIADAATRLYNEFNTLKYDTASHGIRFGDVLELTHAAPERDLQTALFRHLIDRRHGREGVPSSLTMLHKNAWFRQQAAQGHWDRVMDTDHIKSAGMTWEDVLSLAGNKVPKDELWEAMIPNMGYMALLRNLRNFDEAGVSRTVASAVAAYLGDKVKVELSRQLPMSFLSAFRSVSNVRWHMALENALQHSLSNIPEFKGNTLILIDTSSSMRTPMSGRSDLMSWDAAAIFGLALSQRCENATVISFGNRIAEFPLQKGASLLVMLEAFKRGFFFGGGTPTRQAVERHYQNHDRVVILTDEQANYHGHADVTHGVVPQHIPVVTFNLAGYRVGHGPSGTPARVTIGGLSDACFTLLPVLERRAAGHWPF